MSQKSSLYVLLKVLFIIVFLPFVAIWGVWKKTDWNRKNKWLATAGIAVVFLFILISSGENNSKESITSGSKVKNLQERVAEVPKNIESSEIPKISEAKLSDTMQEIKDEKFKVASVVDGDTIKLDNGQVVRYIGIDTPETVHPSKPVQCFGKEASAKNKELVLGKEVRLVKDVSETDKYGRILRYVYVGDTFVNDYLVRDGYANSYSYPPDVKFQDQFKQAEQEARMNKRGLWADGVCDTEITQTPIPTATSVPVSHKSSNSAPSGSFACNCSKPCAQISSCTEAQYQLDVCGCSKRDADKDGVACDSDCQ